MLLADRSQRECEPAGFQPARALAAKVAAEGHEAAHAAALAEADGIEDEHERAFVREFVEAFDAELVEDPEVNEHHAGVKFPAGGDA